MKTRTGEAIGLDTQAVALLWADTLPPEAIGFRPGRWGCVASLFAAIATRGQVAAFDRDSYGCWGGGVGLGFGNCYQTFPGGVEAFCRFLSDGNARTEPGRAMGERMAAGGAAFADDFLNGEKYQADPGTAARFVAALPMVELPARFVVVKPLDRVDPEHEVPQCVTFFVDPDQLSALVVLANFKDPSGERVTIPWAAACQVMGILAYRELGRAQPRGLVGLTDLTARRNVRASLGPNVLSFTAPWPLFQEMERNAEDCFLQRETWRKLRHKPATGPSAP